MRIIWFFLNILFLTSCSIYNSAGRKAFEDRSVGQVQVANAGAIAKECWTQPSSEALWISQDNEQKILQQDLQYKVRTISAEEIEVCLDQVNNLGS